MIETFLQLDEILKLENINSFLINNTNQKNTNKQVIDTLDFLSFSSANKKENKYFSEISHFFNEKKCRLSNISLLQMNQCVEETSKDKNNDKEIEIEGSNNLEIVDNSLTSHSSSQIDTLSEQELNIKNLEIIDKPSKYNSPLKLIETDLIEEEHNIEVDIFKFGGFTFDYDNRKINKKLIAYNTGCTANIAFIKQGYIYIANVGDSLAVLYQNGKAIKLNLEHKLNLSGEKERIINSGSKIINNRIEGRLNLTRAIGDFSFKNKLNLKNFEQAVIAYPEIHKFKITDDMEFILMASDGVWDCVSTQKLCQNISIKLKKEKIDKKIILRNLFDRIISKDQNGK